MEMKKLLVGSPVRQKHQILSEFLQGLDEADKNGFSVSYYFVDDNVDEKSTELLHDFAQSHEAIIKKGSQLTDLDRFSRYTSDEVTHIWDSTSIRKIAYFKDTIIEYALDHNYDYLFFLDSDIVVDHRTLQQLASRNVEIISNVFWTQWKPNWQLEPQCFWMPALNRQSKSPFSPPISAEEARQLQRNFFAKMRIPGMYKVDGLGACTLISRSALQKGVRFKEIPNLSLLGEDRHFCVRAGAAGIDLYFDTVYPVYHIYREAYLDRVDEFKRDGFQYDMCQTYLPYDQAETVKDSGRVRAIKKAASYVKRKTVSRIRSRIRPRLNYQRDAQNNTIALLMIVRDSDLKYLKNVLLSVRHFIDYFIVMDATEDGLAEQTFDDVVKEYPRTVVLAGKNQSDGDGALYQRLWTECDRHQPQWVMPLRANEEMQEGAANAIRALVKNTAVDVYQFKRFSMWNKEEYRVDKEWDGQGKYFPYLMRYQSGYRFTWKMKSDSEKFPDEMQELLYANINLKVRDYRWADEGDRQAEFQRYAGTKQPDYPQEKAGWHESLLDEFPVLKKFSDLSDAL